VNIQQDRLPFGVECLGLFQTHTESPTTGLN